MKNITRDLYSKAVNRYRFQCSELRSLASRFLEHNSDGNKARLTAYIDELNQHDRKVMEAIMRVDDNPPNQAYPKSTRCLRLKNEPIR